MSKHEERKNLAFSNYLRFEHGLAPGFPTEIYNFIDAQVNAMANEVDLSYDEFLRIVNRWDAKQILPKPLLQEVNVHLKQRLSALFPHHCNLVTADVIYKSMSNPDATVCHQDVSYASNQPYSYSVWLPLSSVRKKDGALQILPTRGHETIFPAIDFWQPHFVDNMRASQLWQSQHVTLNTTQDQAIIFSSRAWHASTTFTAKVPRISLVLRWDTDVGLSNWQIPEPRPVEFGIWNCHVKTKKILTFLLSEYFKEKVYINYNALLNTCLNIFEDARAVKTTPCLKDIDMARAWQALKEVSVLDVNASQYGGGDSRGIIYANLWLTLLKPLVSHFDSSKFKPTDRISESSWLEP